MEQILQLTEEEQAYIDRPIEEEFLSFENFVEVYRLRRANERDAYWKGKQLKLKETKEAERFKVGDKVWVLTYRKSENKMKFGTHEQVGGIVHTVHKNGTYDVTSAITFFKGVHCSKRTVKDLSSIEVPEEIKKMSTNRLLKIFKKSFVHRWIDEYDDFYTGHVEIIIGQHSYKPEVIQAELNTREHIYSKQDIELVKQLTK